MKNVLITGGTSKLGFAIIKVYCENNYNIFFTYNENKEKADEIIKYVNTNYLNSIKGFKLNLKDLNEVNDLESKIDKLDVLINNEALSKDSDIYDKSENSFVDILNDNINCTFLMSKIFYKKLKISDGCIVNISSFNAMDSYFKEEHDNIRKESINLVKNLSNSLKGVRVNSISPKWNKKTKELSNPDEIANFVYYISSNEAHHINGSMLVIDGGKNEK